METSTFPIVIWPLNDGNLLGQIIGTSYSVFGTTEREITRAANEQLSKAFEFDNYLDPPDIVNPDLKIYEIPVQMVYREHSKVYPLRGRKTFSVAAVHGHSKQKGINQCHLPLFDESFYYYDKEQLKAMLELTVRDFLENRVPESAMQYRMPVSPTLVEVKVKPKQTRQRRSINGIDTPETLLAVCDRIPLPSNERKSLSRVPDVAWEREKLASTLADALIRGKDNILLVGEQGVGKTTIWHDAVKIVAREAKKKHLPITVWRTTSQRLISKAKYLGEWQQICDDIVEELQRVNGVLWITDLADLLRIGGESPEDSVAAYLQSYIVKGQLRVMGEMRPKQFETASGLLPSFMHCFSYSATLRGLFENQFWHQHKQ